MSTTIVETPIGDLTVIASPAGLRYVLFEGETPPPGAAEDAATAEGTAVAEAALAQLKEYFAGSRTSFDLPLDIPGTAFQQKAWRALATIPYGETISYAEQADRIGHPRATRAVGSANGRNPVPIVLPCHRVVASGGGLGGYGGGLDLKQRLLDHERSPGGGMGRDGMALSPLRVT
ncbi:MAG: methylated-DNA--[protein]-cysteine S-methyltransferase [Actinomycetota bacterium]